MPFCTALNCTNRQKKGCGKTFHRIPRGDNTLLKKWLVNMRRGHWTPSKYSSLCSDHFVEECFDRTGQTTRLRLDAVPTLFSFPQHLTTTVKQCKPPLPRVSAQPQSEPEQEDDSDFCSEECSCSWFLDGQECSTPIRQKPFKDISASMLITVPQTAQEKCCAHDDHTYSNQESPRSMKRKRKLENVNDQLSSMKRRLKISQARAQRLEKKVDSLQEVLKTLKKKDYLTEQGLEMLEKTCDVPAETMERFDKSRSKDVT